MTRPDALREARDAVVLLLRALDPACGQWPTYEQINERLDAYAAAIRAEHAAEIAALKADGERLDWLEGELADIDPWGSEWRVRAGPLMRSTMARKFCTLGTTLRAAIDAARASEPRPDNGC